MGHKPVGRPAKSDVRKWKKYYLNTQKVYASGQTGIKNLNACVYAPLKAPSLTAKYAGLNSGQVINYIEDRSFFSEFVQLYWNHIPLGHYLE